MTEATLDRFPEGIKDPFDTPNWIDKVAAILVTVDTWKRRHKTRRHFAEVDARILRDIGVSEADRFIEINKPFWEA